MPQAPTAEQVMLRLAFAIEEQNRALWALVEQTATLIELSLGDADSDTEAEPTTYLDGSPRN